MNRTELEQTLADAAAEVLETMFFTEVLGDGVAETAGLAARVEFRGTSSGTLGVGISPSAARTLACAFLGSEEATCQQAEEVLGELANMICGDVSCRLWPESHLELLHPEPVVYAEVMAATAHVCLDLGDGALALGLHVEV